MSLALLIAALALGAFNLGVAALFYRHGLRNPRRADDDDPPMGIGS